MKAKLLRRIRSNLHIGITNINSYVWVDKYGYECFEWSNGFRYKFFQDVLIKSGINVLSVDIILSKHNTLRDKRLKKQQQIVKRMEHKYLLNKISR